MKFLVALLVVFAVHGCLAKPKAEAPKDELSVTVLAEKAKELASTISKNLGLTDLDQKKVAADIQEGSTKLIATVGDVLDKLKGEAKAHEGQFDAATKTVQEKLNEAVDNLKKLVGPDAVKKGDEIKTDFDKNFKIITDQVQQLAKANESQIKDAKDTINSYAKSAIDGILEVGKTLEAQLKKNLEEHEKTHKN